MLTAPPLAVATSSYKTLEVPGSPSGTTAVSDKLLKVSVPIVNPASVTKSVLS